MTARASASVAPQPQAHSCRNERELTRVAPDPNDTARKGLATRILNPPNQIVQNLAESERFRVTSARNDCNKMTARSCLTIVLAAGEGTRMRSSRPKVLHAIGGRSLIAHVLAAVRETGGKSAVVIGPGQDKVAAAVEAALPGAAIFVQAERRGAAAAGVSARALRA